MPRPATPIPATLSPSAFTTRDGYASGLTRSRMGARDLETVFRGVRARAATLREMHDLVDAFALRQPRHHVISHTTALRLWGAPLPRNVEQQRALHISSLDKVTPRAGHTIGHTLDPARTGVTTLRGLHLTDPATSWVLSATLLPLDDLVAVGDFLITGSEPFDGAPGLTTFAELNSAVERHAGARGVRTARSALALVRYGPLSRKETQTRLMIVRSGLPEPALNFRVTDARGRDIAMIDLAYPEWKIAIEFESLLHLSPLQFRRDIRRQQVLESAGWKVHRLTSDDTDPSLRSPASVAATHRIRASIETALVHTTKGL